MQEAAGAAIRSRHNALLLSPTGSGKTLAYVLPMLEMVRADVPALQAVVVVPTRELAQQVEEVVKSQTSGAKCMSLYGGRATMDEHRRIKALQPHIVVATPGRLLDHLGKDNVQTAGVKLLVVDEYDKCLELGFRDEVGLICQHCSAVPQVVLTSATALDQLTQGGVDEVFPQRKFQTINFLAEQSQLQQRLEVVQVASPAKDKLQTLAQLLTHIGGESTIVFVAHRESADRVAAHLAQLKFAAVVYHGGMEQEARERALYRFRAGAANVLVSTDLAARGLDIPDVRAIVHYHLPLDEAAFTHRSGRTARWDETGTAYLVVGPEEQCPPYAETDRDLNVDDVSPKAHMPKWTVLYIGRGKKDKLSKADILGFLCKKGGLTSAQIGRIDVHPHVSYVAVQRSAIKSLLQQVGGEKIKGMKTLIEEMRK